MGSPRTIFSLNSSFHLTHALIIRHMSAVLVGFLVPLHSDDVNEGSIPLVEGDNVIGRDRVCLSDKRISRKHITLSAALDGSAHLTVEGANPIVLGSGDHRKKLKHREKSEIRYGDILELIPGEHFFKYLATDNGMNVSERKTVIENRKRVRQLLEDDALARNMQRDEQENGIVRRDSLSTEGSSFEAIHSFNVTKETLHSTFRLLRVQQLPSWANTSSVSIADVIEGDVQVAIFSNYMVDIDWLMSACPTLTKIPNVMIIHGEGDGTLDHMRRKKPSNWILHKPPLPISFGTHHSKAMLLVYPRGVRVVVHTANLIYVDWNNKSQGLWMQDFPWKDENNRSRGCGFEDDLVDYLKVLKWPEFTANLQGFGKINIDPLFFKKFDYGSAVVRLVASVPGYHTGSNMMKWGHLKMRSVLRDYVFKNEFKNSPLVYQFSSLGSLDEKWMGELTSSLSTGVCEDKKPLGLGKPLIVWPTVEDVRCSLEGYAAGNAVPSPLKNVEKEFLKKFWAKWKARHTGRCRAMPHIKTFARYSGQKLAWLLLTSANLSKAAWGALQKNNSQLMIRSYELGVLFLPSSVEQQGHVFSCTGNMVSSENKSGPVETSATRKVELVTLTCKDSIDKTSSEVIQLPLPYEVPPEPYTSEDIPWSWDRRYTKKDVYGEVWPRQVKLYAFQSP